MSDVEEPTSDPVRNPVSTNLSFQKCDNFMIRSDHEVVALCVARLRANLWSSGIPALVAAPALVMVLCG